MTTLNPMPLLSPVATDPSARAGALLLPASPGCRRGSDRPGDRPGTPAAVAPSRTAKVPCRAGRREYRAASCLSSCEESSEHCLHRRCILLAHCDIHAHGPMPLIGEADAFYCILLGHQHRQVVGEADVLDAEASMIRERVRRNLDAELLQGCEELLRMTDGRDRVH